MPRRDLPARAALIWISRVKDAELPETELYSLSKTP